MCIKSPVWMAAFVGPCYITVLFLYIFGRDIFLFILPSRVAKKTKALPFEVPGSAKTLLRVTVGGLLGFATSILVLWELSTDSPHAAIHTVGAFIGAVLAWSDLMEYLFLNVSKILLILDLASDFYVVYANQISGNPDIVRLLLFLIVGPYFILAASIAPMYPTIFDLAEGRSLAITTHGQPIVFMTLKRDTFPRRLALCFYTPVLLALADAALLAELVYGFALLFAPEGVGERMERAFTGRNNTSDEVKDHLAKQAEQYSHLRIISESILESPLQLYVQLSLIRTGFEADEDINFEFLVGSVVISLVNLVGNIYDLKKRSKELGVGLGDYMRFIRRLDDLHSGFVRRLTVMRDTRQVARGLEETIRRIKICDFRGGFETGEIKIDDGETSLIKKGESRVLMDNFEAQNGKRESTSFKIWKRGRGGGHSKITAVLAFVETEEEGGIEDKGRNSVIASEFRTSEVVREFEMT
ncbi:hypothetical protein TrRE_jg12108 [Triparma retinervis]|uniref:Uncharacterized protein n=1 Tax=Triparma retinervis TaxID=2557542 RepID=A0A9W7DZH8_9STRA|nr:hypothetical protein TrRE_jg12108 [Triparma retinervis]